MVDTALDRVVRAMTSESSALERVELSTAVIHAHTRRNSKTGKVERVRTYLRHDQRLGHGLGAKKGIFAGEASAPSSSAPRRASAPTKSAKSVKSPKANPKVESVGVPRRAGGKAGYIHRDPAEQARRKLIEGGEHLNTADRKVLFAEQGIKLNHPDLAPHQLYDAWNNATGKDKQDLENEMQNVAKASALYLAMMDHANKEHKLAAIRDRSQGTWDNAILKFGKAGQALLNVRDRLLTSKAVETASKVKENVKEWGKDVPWRVAEGYLAQALVGGVVAAAAHLGSNEMFGEHIAHFLEGRYTEAAIGAGVALGMHVAVKLGKKHLKKVRAVKPRRADNAIPAVAGQGPRRAT